MSRNALIVLISLAVIAAGFASASEQSQRQVAPATVTMQFPAALGDMQRPAVEFDHKVHTEALESDGCETCHRMGDDEILIPGLKSVLDIDDRDDLIDAYHDACIGCHRDRSDRKLSSGPLTCGECHVRRGPGTPTRAAMAFDYSLHARHAKAFEDKCENCHHVYDEAAEKLKYEKGKEESCRSCHGEVDEERKLSLANASHRACVSCHLKRIRMELEAGPTLCVGCHDLEQRAAIERLEEVPRLLRGQPDTVWIHNTDAKSATVGFNHLGHEPITDSCSTCHHQTLKPCDACHSLQGSAEGSGVTTAQAYHHVGSEHSCVGCHAQHTADTRCAGCHHSMNELPAKSTCTVCHDGPLPGSEALQVAPALAEVQLEMLPAVSDAFPETVVIEGLVDSYEASKLPHAKIVAKLDEYVRSNTLARSFHGDTETLCSGCHHKSPVGTRPPPCRACHADEADPVRDRPGLKVAYHRQCIGCHIVMKIEKQGCTDCHEERAEEVAS